MLRLGRLCRWLSADSPSLMQRSLATTSASHQPSAACILIGDEVRTCCSGLTGAQLLTGKIQDSNSFFLAKFLFSKGISLRRIETVADSIDDICEALLRIAPSHDLVFTSGGIGPTHDDVTFEAVAKAFGRELQLHSPTVDQLEASSKRRGREVTPELLRLATFPFPANVHSSPGSWGPLVVVGNVHDFMADLTPIANAHRLASGVVYTRAVVYTKKLESDFARWLRDLHHANPELRIGSYPWVDGGALTKITVEGLDVDVVRQAVVDITREVDGFDVISP